MRHEDLRKAVHDYYSNVLAQVSERFRRDGVPADFKKDIALWTDWFDQEIEFVADAEFEPHDHRIDYDAFKSFSEVTQEAWSENIDQRLELRKAYREHLNGLISWWTHV